MEPIKEVEFERLYNSPVEILWQAWTDPEQLKQWWGPDNVSIPECQLDLRVGGRIYIVMEAGEAMGPYKGTRWSMEGEYNVVEDNSRLIYTVKAWTEGKKETTEIDQVTEVYFDADNDQTRLRVKAIINQVGPDAKYAVEGMQYGFNQQLDKLTLFLS